MTSVCIFSAAWRRFDVTRLVLKQRQRLCVELAAGGVDATNLIAADDENREIAAEYGCATLETPNEPLGRKCSKGLRHAADLADWVCWVGSDDWIHPDVFEPLLDRHGELVVVTGRRLAVVDLATGVLQIISSPSKYGAIPWLIDSRLLRTNRPAIRPDLPRGLDGALIRGIRLARKPFAVVEHDPHPFRCIDFKSDLNLSPFHGLVENLALGRPADAWDALSAWFPTDLVDDARTLSQGVAECA